MESQETSNQNPVSDYTCLQESLKNICQKHHKDFGIFLFREWGFMYEEDGNQSIGERINSCRFFRTNQFMEKYMGFKVDFYKNTENLKQIMKEALEEDKSVLAGMDAYGCSWNPAYKKSHVPHFFLIMKWNEKEQTVTCMDTYYSEEEYILDYRNLKQYFRDLRVIENVKPMEGMGLREIKSILVENYEQLDKGIQYYFQAFANAVVRVTDIAQLFQENTVVGNCMLIQKLRNLIIARTEISKLIFLYYPQENHLAEKFAELGKQWEFIKLLFIKLFLTKKISKEKLQCIADFILETGWKEEELYQYIKKGC